MARSWLVAAALPAVLAWLHFLLSTPDIAIVGNVTVDLVDGRRSLGGASSYAAAVAAAWGTRACVLTAHNPAEAALGRAFEGHDLVEVPASHTLLFEHSYTFWGNHRKLRVTQQPNVTLSWRHLPPRCRRARSLLLGPLMPEDLDPASFVRPRPWWQRALGLPPQRVGLMAQGLQRSLDSGGRVQALREPSRQLADALGPSTLVFLSDVETDAWPNGTVPALAARTAAFLVTRGDKGADEHRRGRAPRRVPVFPVDTVQDTNGAGDTFATAYMLALARGHPDPVAVAHWAGGVAVSQPQACKPGCVTEALRAAWASQPAGTAGVPWAALQRLLLPLARLLRLAPPAGTA